ncbi:MAG: (Fe-S)-binding protein, partial [Chloroflexia bacterium]
RCPSGVDLIGFVRGLRALARQQGEKAPCSHGGLLEALMRLMARSDVAPERLGWLDADLEVCSEGETLYFVGCLPFFEVVFSDLGFPAGEIARSTVRLLNAAGVRPVLLPDERCCGHDLLWQGDVEGFRRLARANQAAIRRVGVRRIVTGCAECARTLALDYPAFGYELGAEVLHLSQWLADAALSFARSDARLAFQDPCRLGRHLGEYAAPRTVLAALGELVEMAHSGRLARCCGTSGWSVCGAVQKRLQRARLQEARAAGADLLVTACPKCQVHFRCVLDDPDVTERIPVLDLAVLAAGALER